MLKAWETHIETQGRPDKGEGVLPELAHRRNLGSDRRARWIPVLCLETGN